MSLLVHDVCHIGIYESFNNYNESFLIVCIIFFIIVLPIFHVPCPNRKCNCDIFIESNISVFFSLCMYKSFIIRWGPVTFSGDVQKKIRRPPPSPLPNPTGQKSRTPPPPLDI